MPRLVLLLLLAWSPLLSAHEIRPAYLQINETAPQHYDVLWKVPSNGDRVLDIQPRFDEALALAPVDLHTVLQGFVVYRYRVSGGDGLPGTSLRIDNLARTTVDVLVNLSLQDGTKHTLLLNPKTPSTTIPGTPSASGVALSYTRLGIGHILLGFDHLLFVAALMLVVSGWGMLVKAVTAFTAAHSITLALVVLGYIALPPQPVEVLIALSIVLLCAEAVRLRAGATSLAIQWPWLVAFAFGLLHGFGFAGALLELGLPQGDAPLALLFFNIGVELGQLLFIAVLLLLTRTLARFVTIPPRAPVAASYLIGSLAAFWVFERLYGTFA